MSLRLKTILGVASIEAVLLIFLVSSMLNYMRNSIEEQLTQRALTAVTLFATTTKDAVLSYDLASLEAFAKEVMKNPGMVYARVLGSDGRVFSSAGDTRSLAAGFSKDHSLEMVDDDIYDTGAVIEEAGTQYGSVQIGLSTRLIKETYGEVKGIAGGIVLFEMAAVALFSFFLGTYLTAQLKSLQKAARLIGRGQMDISLPIKGRDEVSEVASAFNKMVVNLVSSQKKREEYERQLTQLNASLEDRVRRRTAALEEKNKELKHTYKAIKEAHQKVLQAEKLASVGQLAAGVAHEINNPVGFVNSNLESLKDYLGTYRNLLSYYRDYMAADAIMKTELAEKIEQYQKSEDIDFVNDDIESLLADSIEGTTRVRDIVQALKDYSRVDTHEKTLCNIDDCIQSAIKIVNNEIKYACELVTEFQTTPDIMLNRGQISQVIINILVNAAQACRENGVINLKTYLADSRVVISISDNGEGIAKESMDKLFEPFFTTKNVGEGTGLGLSIVHGIVEEHGGTISVDSELGVGTAFKIALPL